MCAFGGTELLRQKRLWEDTRDRQKEQDQLTTVNAFGTVAFGDAPTSTDVFKKTVLQLRDNAVAEALREFEKQRAKFEAELHTKRVQNGILARELVRQTRLLEQCQIARKADEDLLRRLQLQCDELSAQHAEAELQLVEFEGNNRRATDRTRE
ncbi:hypothetical protein AXG93_1563s1000 [Marchantia polymorpha subsp. ruderalis]|uniref:Uncharacterized protein n=1 Tax=Marchantia polymorpha subsp. ruderalis TaxID=1480154 RepID=A0A176VDE2_MARPO|nr:hypothetical protein AXG93_1563s1000 [Marchantia polymorpha subsp. ruderalis]